MIELICRHTYIHILLLHMIKLIKLDIITKETDMNELIKLVRYGDMEGMRDKHKGTCIFNIYVDLKVDFENNLILFSNVIRTIQQNETSNNMTG